MNDQNPYVVSLPGRGLIHLEGEDRHAFLQNLVSNDIELLQKQKSVYACLLTAQGKFLHDFFIMEGDGFLLIDCEGGERAQDLYKRLLMYRLRAKVQVSVEENNAVFALFGTDRGIPDPRHAEMGRRSFEKPDDIDEKPFENWDRTRIRLGIPDGSRDMEIEKSTLLECRIDEFNGINFKKGCYIGQELTARMHYRGLAKKHLYPVQGAALPPPGTDIMAGDRLIGEMRSSCGDTGLALLKDDALDALPGAGLALFK